eukprot:3940423-Rhodomonas_salina.1
MLLQYRSMRTYALSGTALGYGDTSNDALCGTECGIGLCASYGICGTEVGYGASSSYARLFGRKRRPRHCPPRYMRLLDATRCPVLMSVVCWYPPTRVLPDGISAYAMCGIDVVYAAMPGTDLVTALPPPRYMRVLDAMRVLRAVRCPVLT